MKVFIKVLFILVVCALVLALAFTIIGSSTSHDGLLNVGIILWLSSCALFFFWFVMLVWGRTKKYKK